MLTTKERHPFGGLNIPNALPRERMRIDVMDSGIKRLNIKIKTPIQPPRHSIKPFPLGSFV